MASGAPREARIGDIRLGPTGAALGGGAFAAVAWVLEPEPSVNWTVLGDESWQQAAVEMELDGDARLIEGGAFIGVEWPFAPLEPELVHAFRLRARSGAGVWTDWSPLATIGNGLLPAPEWTARWLSLSQPIAAAEPFQIEREFDAGDARYALLRFSARGAVVPIVNGVALDDEVLSPGWPAYERRDVYSVRDVSALLGGAGLSVGFEVAGGWYTEEYGFSGMGRRVYADQPAIAAELLLLGADGAARRFATDESWQGLRELPLRSSSLYQGEEYDARRQPVPAPLRCSGEAARPEPFLAEPIRRLQTLSPQTFDRRSNGGTVIDFGQNLVGRLRLLIDAPEGHEIVIRHAEVMERGELATRPLRGARATDRFVSAGQRVEWEPRFTYHGFRFAEIEGWTAGVDLHVQAIAIGTDVRRTAWFDSSDPLVDRLHENTVWSMRGNFMSVPTDCPQRDERFGWTGDIQMFAPAAATLADCGAFLGNWLRDLQLEQGPNGDVPLIVPDVLRLPLYPAAAWGDAATVVPWTLWQRFGDLRALRRQWPSMRAWVDRVLAAAGDGIWSGGQQFGDWLDPEAPPDAADRARTHPDIVATAYLYRSLGIAASTGDLLGEASTVEAYRAAARRVRSAFIRRFVTPDGRMMSDAPTAYSLAIEFGLAPDELRHVMGARLAEIVRESGYRIGTGFVGTPILLDALTSTGQHRAASRLIRQRRHPSWLYPVTMGATTIWERWDSLRPDGSINSGEMTSFNHYAFGAVVDWLHRALGGIAPGESAYATIEVAPTFLPGFSHASSTIDTRRGRVRVAWRRVAADLEVTAHIPHGTRARLSLGGRTEEVGEGVHRRTIPDFRATPLPSLAGTLDDDLHDIVEHEQLVEDLILGAGQVSAAFADRLAGALRWTRGVSLRDATAGQPPGVVEALARVMGRHVNRLTAGGQADTVTAP